MDGDEGSVETIGSLFVVDMCVSGVGLKLVVCIDGGGVVD